MPSQPHAPSLRENSPSNPTQRPRPRRHQNIRGLDLQERANLGPQRVGAWRQFAWFEGK